MTRARTTKRGKGFDELRKQVDADPARRARVEEHKAAIATAKVSWNPYLHDPRLGGLLGRIEANTVLVCGDDDRLIPPVYGERLAERIPNAQLELVPEYGHVIWFEKANAAARAGAGAPRWGADLAQTSVSVALWG